jgi:GWxTD domain-containing protein
VCKALYWFGFIFAQNTEKIMRRLVACFLLLSASMKVMAIEALVAHDVFYAPDSTQTGKLIPNAEIYWQINPRTLHYVTSPEKTILAHVKADILFTNDSGFIKEDQFILQTIPKTTLKELAKNKIIDLHRYNIAFGLVRMKLVLTDMADSTNKFTFTDSFMVSVPGKDPLYSGLQLLDTAFESTQQTPYYKKGKEQVPSCTNFLDESRHILHYYAELYNTDRLPPANYPLIQKVFISKKPDIDAYGDLLKRDTVTAQNIVRVSGNLGVESLPSGNYYLRATLENKIHKVILEQALFFQILNPHPVVIKDTGKAKKPEVVEEASDTGIEHINLVNLNKTFVAKYSLPEVRGILRMLLPVSDDMGTRTINGFLKTPDELYMRYYIYNYFLYINKENPEKAWKEYSNKVIGVNKLYTGHGTPGYATDRGFMYLRYGPPTDIITVENESGALPYEIWQYNTLTQMNHRDVADALFLFYRPQGALDYKLLHCTVEGEVQNEAWRTYLYVGGGGGTSGNSRAEQYIGNR